MASDRSDHADRRVSPPPDGPPRDHILTQVTPREGWTGGWGDAIEELCAFVEARYRDANLFALRQRLAPLLQKASSMVAVAKVEVGKSKRGRNKKVKAVTFIRDQVVDLRGQPPEEAVEASRHAEPVFRDYLDGRWEAEDAEVDRPVDPNLASDERAARRHALVVDPKNDVLPQPCRGPENAWATVADLVAELLADVTGDEPKRTYHHYGDGGGADARWPLAFFKRFAALAIAPAKPPRLDKVWRNALDARKRN